MSNNTRQHDAITLNPNTEGRDFVCGDIHGNIEQVETHLRLNKFDKTKDRLIAVGDLVDRGADSLGVLRLLREPWFFSTLGNHDVMMMNGVSGATDQDLWHEFGGDWYPKLSPAEQEEVAEIIDSHVSRLPLAITIDYGAYKVGFVHADPPGDWQHIDDPYTIGDKRLWGRTRWMWKSQIHVENVDIVFVGHTPSRKVQVLGNVVYLDTGSGYEDGWLTMKDVQAFTEDQLARRQQS